MDKNISAYNQICPPPINNTDTYLGVNELFVNEQEREFLRKLGSFTAPYLQEKLLADKQFKSEAQYTEAFIEFKKFVALIKLSGKNLAMTSKDVDKIWHQFILFTRQYHTFCDEFLGRYLHHVPKTSFTPLGPNGVCNFRELYIKYFGAIHSTWEFRNPWVNPHPYCVHHIPPKLPPCGECDNECDYDDDDEGDEEE